MNVLKYLTAAVSFFLLAGQLQAVDTGLQQLETKFQEMKSLNDAINCRDCSCGHKSSDKSHNETKNDPAYLSAATPLNYGGQTLVGTNPVPVVFGVIVDKSRPSPLSENNGVFTVRKSGHYLINWSCVGQNDSNIDGAGFSAVLVLNGNQQPPFVQLAILGALTDGSTPGTATATGSTILQLNKGDNVQLNVTNLGGISGLLVQSASITFVRVATKD